MTNDNQHWTADEDLLERFVLGRLNDDERAPLEDHLRRCGQCRTAVENEARLAAGVRLYKREELKSRLQADLRERNRKKSRPVSSISAATGFIERFIRNNRIPWYVPAAVSAAVVVAVGFALYDGWFAGRQLIVEEKTVNALPAEQPAGENHVKEKTRPASPDMHAEDVQRTVKRTAEAAKRPADEALNAGRGPESERAVTIDAAPPVLRSETPAASVSPAEPKNVEQGVWVEGRESQSPGDFARIRTNAHLSGQTEERSLKRDQVEKKQKTQAAAGGEMKILQQPFNTLSVFRQNTVRSSQNQAVMTVLKQSGDTTEIILFPEQPIADEEIKSVRAILVNEDSLILLFPNRQIFYQLPQGWRSGK